MYSLIETEEFTAWMTGLKDRTTRARLMVRLNKAKAGNLGDVKPVGGGVWEMREVFGPGWRMYYVERSAVLILMLGGGNKSSQVRDIELVRQHAKELRDDEQDKDPAV